MKQTLLLVALLCIGASAYAQNVNIPNAAFKNRLINANTTNGIAKDAGGNNLVIDVNDDNEIQQSEASAVYQLRVNNSAISSLQGIEAFTNLTVLEARSNTLTDLNLSALTNLTNLDLGSNSLTALDISVLVNLQQVDVKYNNLAQLNLSGLNNLTSLIVGWNNLSSLDLSGVPALEFLGCWGNNITNLDLSAVSLTTLLCGDNPLMVLDITNQQALVGFSAYGCHSLTALYIKNGHIDDINSETFGDCPNLEIICADEEELQILLDTIAQMQEWDIPVTASVTTSCSAPGEGYNIIGGIITFDSNNDGCGSGDALSNFIRVNSSNGQNESVAYTVGGNYNLTAQTGTHTVTPQFENNWFVMSPETTTVTFNALAGSTALQNFCITPNGIHADVEVIIMPVGMNAPGFDSPYKLIIKNKGNQNLSGTIVLNYDDAVLEFVSALPAQVSATGGAITWNYSNLLPFENRSIAVVFNLNSPTENPPLIAGDVLEFSAVVNPLGGDETPEDNEFSLERVVGGSMDPNGIVCLEGDFEEADAIGDYLHYAVNFENIGQDPAQFVVVTNEIDIEKFDINSLEIVNTSHDTDIILEGNVITFRFNDINLEPGVYGSVVYKIKTLAILEEGDYVNNDAVIVFDFNEPIATNTATTTFQTLSRGDFATDESVKVYPNPSASVVNIIASTNLQAVELYDVQGRLLQLGTLNEANGTLDISQRATGIYVLKIKTDAGVKVEKIAKQ